jgi:hypothetical protein
MEILTTRTLRYTDENGDEKDLVLMIFVPFQVDAVTWKCDLAFDPPIIRQPPSGEGVDFLQAFVSCLHLARVHLDLHARVYLATSKLKGRVHWDGMAHCGLPGLEERRPMPEMDVLTTRVLSYPDDKGGEREMVLTVFVPLKEDEELWKCGFMFGPPAPTPVNYGYGKDYTEALLDCLALVRTAYDTLVPKDMAVSGDLYDCSDFPVTKDRSFRLTRRGEPPKNDT